MNLKLYCKYFFAYITILAAFPLNEGISRTLNGDELDITSTILRERIIVAKQIIKKNALYVAFTTNRVSKKSCKVVGTIYHNNQILSIANIEKFSGMNGNLFFDLPKNVPNGRYIINIQIFDEKLKLIDYFSNVYNREEFKSNEVDNQSSKNSILKELCEYKNGMLSKDIQKTLNDEKYVIFQRPALEYVYSDNFPNYTDIIKEIRINVVKNEYENFSFCVFSDKDIGKVEVKINILNNRKKTFKKSDITINHIREIEDQRGFGKNHYKKIPSLIVPGASLQLKKNEVKRFWFTLHVPEYISLGEHAAEIIIFTGNSDSKKIPLVIKVNNIVLEDIPNVHYFMLMTYEFTELANSWDSETKTEIYKHALKVIADYKAHGMTTICPHSPFISVQNDKGEIILDDIKAAMIACRDVGFQNPIIWYMGHLIQTSKPKHPGNIIGYEPTKSKMILKNLISEILNFARNNNCPEPVFLPIDEPDDNYQDYKEKRYKITNELLQIIKELGGKTALTAMSFKSFRNVDYCITGQYNETDSKKVRKHGGLYIEYNNKITTDCNNPAYARYIYGYYTWKKKLDGMSSWTFQNTQNATGEPDKADTNERDIFLAYPDIEGPMATIMWEAIREGVDDHKLIYQLQKKVEVNERQIASNLKRKYHKIISLIKKNNVPFSRTKSVNSKNDTYSIFQIKDQIIDLIQDIDNL